MIKTKDILVGKIVRQVQGVDFFPTFAPSPSWASVAILASVANENGLKLFSLDVSQAFVRSQLKYTWNSWKYQMWSYRRLLVLCGSGNTTGRRGGAWLYILGVRWGNKLACGWYTSSIEILLFSIVLFWRVSFATRVGFVLGKWCRMGDVSFATIYLKDDSPKYVSHECRL